MRYIYISYLFFDFLLTWFPIWNIKLKYLIIVILFKVIIDAIDEL